MPVVVLRSMLCDIRDVMPSLSMLLRAFALCLSVLLAAQATGAMAAAACCDEDCATDELLGECPPSCTACTCAAPRIPTVPMLTSAASSALLLTELPPCWSALLVLPGPAPDGILHVPIPRRA